MSSRQIGSMQWKRHPNHNTQRASGKACPDDCAYLPILTWGAEYLR
jgi:hypothetical protein